ncbi:hypothetical protein BFP72_16775 [Reichenbachiella sp. 5M10]|uniref:stage II sporulation protein M n=1 Tax=Reichenbachiella sp. 5M10 TaxID=1889772 RepID=UPI000C161A36|nr:stage II sporulation protein M [Reichenbachiella sp. 5M10]PIB36939.1 hypothetical protein BFP72_16775 [Reichenbachiella sp. 5M10]
MKEALFIKLNRKEWVEMEDRLNARTTLSADRLTAYYIRLTDDLSFVRSNFPQSKTHTYLNELASVVYQRLYRNKKESKSRFITFWKEEFPQVMYDSRRELIYSFVIFMVSALIGALSVALDDTFVRLILGDQYVNMTLQNIEEGDPMAVYKEAHQMPMFLGITVNNIMVSFMVFAYGVMLSVGAAFMLMRNGIMLGAFQYFFHQQGLLATSALTIWIHGAIEISSIVIAGAGGLVIGNSIMFPGTLTRKESFKRGAKRGIKIVVGLVPLFIIAGFLESFVTRMTDLPTVVKLIIIFGTLAGVIYYTIIYPNQLFKHGKQIRS